MSKEQLEQLVRDLEILFEWDNYEEIAYPVIRSFFLHKIGKPEEGEYEKRRVEEAFSILAQERK